LTRHIVLAATALAMAGVGFQVTARTQVFARQNGPSCSASAPDTVAASAMARACRSRVQVVAATTETTQVYAEASGAFTMEQYVVPVRVRQGDGWVPVDTTLSRRPDGTFAPAAVSVPTGFSGGGTGPLVRLTVAGGELSLSWPAPLPAPTVHADAVVYPEVLPGVDLRLRATAVGFAEVLVIKNRQAAANPAVRTVHFGLSSRGLTFRPRSDGGLDAVAADGSVAATSPRAAMWDSGAAGAEAGAAADAPAADSRPDGAATATARLRLTGGDLTVAPDAAMLAAPGTRYPVYVDPDFGAPRVRWAYSDLPGEANNDGVARVGKNPLTGALYRSYFQFDTRPLAGKHVLAAVFRSWMTHSWKCDDSQPVYLWWSSAIPPGINGGRADWAPPLNSPRLDERFEGHADLDPQARCANPQQAHLVEFSGGLTGLLQTRVDDGTNTGMTFAISAAGPNGGESIQERWKKFDPGQTSLTVTYNSVPTTPDQLSTHNQGCATGTGRPVVATGMPTLKARMNDVDNETDLTGTFAWQRFDASAGTWSALGSATTGQLTSGATAQVTASPALAPGIYRWQVQTADLWWTPAAGLNTDYSPWSPWCEFEVDTTPPHTPVLSPDAANTPFVAGRTVRLNLSPGGGDTDVTGYNWWVVDGQGTHPVVFAAGATATVDWTPSAGQGTVFVAAKDRVQTSQATAQYAFNAAQPSTEVARWSLAEPAGSTSVSDSTGAHRTATVTGGVTLGVPGRVVNGDTALALDGSTGSAATAGPVLDTSRNFTVSAWVKLTGTGGNRTVVAADGTRNSSFLVQYAANVNHWSLTIPNADADGWTAVRAVGSSVPAVGVWTQLTGVYDSVTGGVRLYVNGALDGQTTGAHVFAATGAFTIGRAKNHGQPVDLWPGTVSDVRVWDRALSDQEAARLADPRDPANLVRDTAGNWLFDEGNGAMAFDSSAYFNDLTISLDPSVAWTADGHTGTALSLNGSGAAQTDRPVLYTDQSFTVSAWVKLTASTLPGGTLTAVSQDGTSISGFYLGYRQHPGPSWCFLMRPADTTAGDAAAACTTATTADLNTWLHLTGVYDASTGKLALYVGGTRVDDGTATLPGRWTASGPLAVGRALWTPATGGPAVKADYWVGAVDDVTLYVGVTKP
jgi:hypothetical protein